MPFEIVKNDITSMSVDAIVYAETQQPFSLFNFNPLQFQKRGKELVKSRQEVGAIPIGEAKIASASNLDAKYIIHTSAPIWHGGLYNETKLLRSCYEKTFQLAIDNQCQSIALPIIASDNLGFPKKMTQQIAFSCISDFLPSHDLKIYIVVPGITGILLSGKTFSDVKMHIKKNYVEKPQQHETQDILIPRRNEGNEPNPAFSKMLIQYMKQTNAKDAQICRNANMTKQHFSDIKNNVSYKPTKNEAISLGMALKLTPDKMKAFIGNAGYTLTNNSKFDIIIEYCIAQNCYDIIEINQILFRFEQPLLGNSNFLGI